MENRGRASDKNPKSGFLRLMASTSFRQVRIPAEGLLKAAPATFTTVNFEAGHTFQLKGRGDALMPIELGLQIQNLSNVRYREYLNFFRYFTDETGINVALRMKMLFGGS